MALADIRGGARNEEGIAAALPRLAGRFGTRFQAGEAIRAQHAHTTTYIPAQLPDGVVFVENVEEVKAVVLLCAELKVPVIPFGTGSSLEGQVNAPNGGISIDFSNMKRVLEVNADDLDCTVEPGITRRAQALVSLINVLHAIAEILDGLGAFVGRAVVDDDQLHVLASLRKNTFDRFGDVRFLVIDRHDDADARWARMAQLGILFEFVCYRASNFEGSGPADAKSARGVVLLA